MSNRDMAEKHVFLFDLSALFPIGSRTCYKDARATLWKLQNAGHTIVFVKSNTDPLDHLTNNELQSLGLGNRSARLYNLFELVDGDQPEKLRIFVHGELPSLSENEILSEVERRGYRAFNLAKKVDSFITKSPRYQSLIESYCSNELDHWRQETGRRRRETSNMHPFTLGTMVAAGFITVATVITAACTGGLAPVILGVIAIVLAFASFVSACVQRVSESTATPSPSLSSR